MPKKNNEPKKDFNFEENYRRSQEENQIVNENLARMTPSRMTSKTGMLAGFSVNATGEESKESPIPNHDNNATITFFFCGTGEDMDKSENVVSHLFGQYPGDSYEHHDNTGINGVAKPVRYRIKSNGHDTALHLDGVAHNNDDLGVQPGSDYDKTTRSAAERLGIYAAGTAHGRGTDENIGLALRAIAERNRMAQQDGVTKRYSRINVVGWSRGSWAGTQRFPRIMYEIQQGDKEQIIKYFGKDADVAAIQSLFQGIEFNAVAFDTVRGPTNHPRILSANWREGVDKDGMLPPFCRNFLHVLALNETSWGFEGEIPVLDTSRCNYYQVGFPGHHATVVGNPTTRFSPTGYNQKTEGPGQPVGVITRRLASDFLRACGTTLQHENPTASINPIGDIEALLRYYAEIDANREAILDDAARELYIADLTSGVKPGSTVNDLWNLDLASLRTRIGYAAIGRGETGVDRRAPRALAFYVKDRDAANHQCYWKGYRSVNSLTDQVQAAFGTMLSLNLFTKSNDGFGVSHRLALSVKYAAMCMGTSEPAFNGDEAAYKNDLIKLLNDYTSLVSGEIDSNRSKSHDFEALCKTLLKSRQIEADTSMREIEQEFATVIMAQQLNRAYRDIDSRSILLVENFPSGFSPKSNLGVMFGRLHQNQKAQLDAQSRQLEDYLSSENDEKSMRDFKQQPGVKLATAHRQSHELTKLWNEYVLPMEGIWRLMEDKSNVAAFGNDLNVLRKTLFDAEGYLLAELRHRNIPEDDVEGILNVMNEIGFGKNIAMIYGQMYRIANLDQEEILIDSDGASNEFDMFTTMLDAIQENVTALQRKITREGMQRGHSPALSDNPRTSPIPGSGSDSDTADPIDDFIMVPPGEPQVVNAVTTTTTTTTTNPTTTSPDYHRSGVRGGMFGDDRRPKVGEKRNADVSDLEKRDNPASDYKRK